MKWKLEVEVGYYLTHKKLFSFSKSILSIKLVKIETGKLCQQVKVFFKSPYMGFKPAA